MAIKEKNIDKFDLRDFLLHGDIDTIVVNTKFNRNYVRKILTAGPFDHPIREEAYKIITDNKESLEEALFKIDELKRKGLKNRIQSYSAA